jgi:hypothetical protein
MMVAMETVASTKGTPVNAAEAVTTAAKAVPEAVTNSAKATPAAATTGMDQDEWPGCCAQCLRF